MPVAKVLLLSWKQITAATKAQAVAAKLAARDAEEEERRRKLAAAEKLRALEESIAARTVVTTISKEVRL